ncbi:hypothetical protein V2J09_023350 [Rumex salicifolius]
MAAGMSSSCFGLLFLSFLTLISIAIADSKGVRTLYWVVKETNFTRLCSTKSMITVNDTFPGPPLKLYTGGRIKVNVRNEGPYGITLHWHGVKQPRNSWSDGPEYVAQCPIQPGKNYTYDIILSDEEGTLWWHAHSDWSRATVHGGIFVYPKPPNTYPFTKPDAEVPITLASWYKGDVMQVITQALAVGSETNKSDAFTINGQPGDTMPCSSKDMFRLDVDHGKTYLLRIINSVLNENMFFMVADHKLTVVGMDGAYIKPIVTNYIMITPGQTMDVLLTANQNPSHYYMASRAFGELIFANHTTTAILRYSGNYTPPANASFPDLPDYGDIDKAIAYTRRLRSLDTEKYPIDVPKTVQKRLIMTLSLNTVPCDLANGSCTGPNDDKIASSLNNISFSQPKTDVLQAYYLKLPSVYRPDFPSKPYYVFNYTADPMLSDNYTMAELNGTRVKMIDYNTTVEIVFQGTNVINASETHPMHVHGYSFYVVGWGLGNFDEKKNPRGYNLDDPPLVNTIGVPKNGWTAIRFRADNPDGPTRATSLRPPGYINPCT